MKTSHPDSSEARRQFEEEVFPAELDYIRNRRQAVGDDRGSLPSTNEISTANDLIGVALSGGGIRSASFSLGFLQSLGSPLFRRIDYFSTVSGGGFIGSSISALMANSFYRGAATPIEFPFPLTRHELEPSALSHLRNNSNYLTPGGVGDLFRLVAVLLRGIILNSLAMLPFLLLVCLIVLLIYGQQLSDRARIDDQVKRIDGLLDRYYGNRLQTEREIDFMLEVLEAEALLRIDEGKTRGDVIHHLRPALLQDDAKDLISGNGTEASPYRLKPAASREDLARVLLEGDVLQRFEVIEEIDLLARSFERKGYRHGPTVSSDKEGEDEPDLEDSIEKLREAAVDLELIRPDTNEAELEEFLEEHWNPSFKPILQALYNGEYLREEAVGRLVREELDGRSPFYAYGWYQGRVGVPFAGAWVESSENRERLEDTIVSELGRLTPEFGVECLENAGTALPACLRPGTTPADVERLLSFEQLTVSDPAEPIPAEPAAEWARLRDRLARLNEVKQLADVVRAFYLSDYLNENWVFGVLRAPAPWMNLYDALPAGSLDVPISRFLMLKEETVCADLVEVLRARKFIESTVCPASSLIDAGDGPQILEALWPFLDPGWVHGRLHVYRYGWHRSRMGQTSPGDWCGSAGAGPGAAGCPAISDERWNERERYLQVPSRWDPNNLSLPFTWVAIRVSLGWVLLFPFLLFAARAIYASRRREVARESNPLRGLLSSDQSLYWRDLSERTFGSLLMLIFGIALVELLPYAVHHFHSLSVRDQWRTLAVGTISLLVTALGGPALALFQRIGRRVTLVLLAVSGPLLLLTAFVYTMEYAVYAPPPTVDAALGLFDEKLTLWFQEGGRRLLDPIAGWLLFLVVSALSIGLAWVIDINSTSLHGFYRDRIAKAFMVGVDTAGDVEPEEDLGLEAICPAGSGAPYLLINAALNLQGSSDRTLRGRASAFLFFSRDHIGGLRTGFCRTRDMAVVFPYAHLASAMAISGAAVSPNMGRYKSGTLAVLMSLLNTRLALWMPHPGAVRKLMFRATPRSLNGKVREAWSRFRLRTPATLLLRELFGRLHDRGSVVNVSDGGHIENTGALELLRRRCREIILVDGEADPGMAFGGLALLQRIARIDMGIEIEIQLDALRPDERGLSRTRSAVGLIHYPARRRRGFGQELAEEKGRLLYVKLAVTGTEGETVAEFRARYREFPHQSTGDQFFDEGQLEAYRRLGQLAGQEVFEKVNHLQGAGR